MQSNLVQSNFHWGKRTLVMGVINLSLDSFSGDGLAELGAVLRRVEEFENAGADLIDIGAQSTRPGHKEIAIDEEIRRLSLVLPTVRACTDLPVTLDTYRVEVAEYGLENGVNIINEVWGLKKAPRIANIVAEHKAGIILMHNQIGSKYNDLVQDIQKSLRCSVDIALTNGVERNSIIIDPGIGFGKTPIQNLEVLHRLSEMKELDLPVLVGVSRKSVIGFTLDLPVEERLEGTAAINAIAIANGADVIRVHDVLEMGRVAKMSDAVVRFQKS